MRSTLARGRHAAARAVRKTSVNDDRPSRSSGLENPPSSESFPNASPFRGPFRGRSATVVKRYGSLPTEPSIGDTQHAA